MSTEQIAVVLYIRASSDEQTASCPDQLKAWRQEVKKRGYKIIREYVDDGVSGSREIEKRIAFHQLIADSYKREFTRICVWDSSRFARLDSQAAGEYKLKLRKNGVQGLDSLAEGFIDWTTQIGRLTDALMSEANYEFALKISRNTIRGRISKVEQGIYVHGMTPYGYDKEYTGNGQTLRIARQEKFRMPRGWTRRLVINDQEAEVVRLIYDLFVNRGKSILSIMRELARRDIPPAWHGKPWSWDSIDKVLRDKSYIGYMVMKKSKWARKEAHNRIPAQEIPGVVPPILDDQIWHDAQRMLRKPGWTQREYRAGKTDRALASILICGHCGYRLTARSRNSKVYYSCSSAIHIPNACPQWRATEEELLPVVIRELVRAVDEEVLTQLTPSEDKVDAVAPHQKEVDRLRDQVKRAVLRAATADDDLLAEFQEAAADLKKELTAAEERLRLMRHVETEGGPAVWASWWAELRPGLVLASDDPELVDELLEAQKRHPALAKVRGRGGWDEFKEKARKALVRVAADGDPDPLKAILPQLLDGESKGVLLDAESLRGVLRKLGCEVTLWWKANPARRMARDPRWVVDRGSIKINFRWSDHGIETAAGCGGSAARTGVLHPARIAVAAALPSVGSA